MSDDRDNELPVVDLQRLAQCVGLRSWPKEQLLHNSRQRMAARVITDAMQRDSVSGQIHADIVIANATAWINRAYDEGLRKGIAIERRSWERKIAKLFDLALAEPAPIERR